MEDINRKKSEYISRAFKYIAYALIQNSGNIKFCIFYDDIGCPSWIKKYL